MLLKGFALVLAGHALRLGAGMAVFVVIARQLGPQEFGQFAFFLAVAVLLAMPVNFGFGAHALRSFGAHPERALQIMGEIYAAKLLLAGAVAAVALACSGWMPASAARLLLLLLVAQLFESFAEYYVLGFRIRGDFEREAGTACLVSVWHLAVVAAAVLFWPTAEAAAGAFAVSRVSGMVVTRLRATASMGRVVRAPLAGALRTLKQSWAYALELGLMTAYSQLDALLINFVLGPAAVGLFQAGMKLVDGASRAGPALAHVLLPELARQQADEQAFGALAGRTGLIFAAFGLAGALLLWLGAAQITAILFGPQYQLLDALLPLFGLILLLRFLETGFGLLLVARNLQSVKVWFVSFQVAIMLACGSYALSAHGLAGWQWLHVATLSVLLGSYVLLLIRWRNFIDR